MKFNNPFKKPPMEQPKIPKPKSDDCEIEIRNTAQGRKIRFKGACKKEQIQAFASQNGIDLDMGD